MSFYKKITFNKVKHKAITYAVSSEFTDRFCGDGLDVLSPDLVPLDIPGEHRSVLLSKKLNVVIKHNQLNGVRRRLFAHFGWQNYFGKYSLTDEYKNLKALSHIAFVPKVYAFGTCNSFLLKKEVLVIEYYKNALTADEMIIKYPDRKYEIIERVFELFLSAWNAGFAHMDPNPKNILFLNHKDLKIIDFECCCLAPKDKEFYFGFSMGYFFHFWFYKYFEDSEYSKHTYRFLSDNCSDLDMQRFNMYYEIFKKYKISRKLRYKSFKSVGERAKLIGRIK